ncbi:MAG: sulfurtransferase [Burkholderiales bacterium]|nr:sulfurtransferase [Anaerolineae bacterium]
MSDSPLVSTAWLREHLNDANLRIVDIRGHVRPANEPTPHYFNHRADYDQSHIPGAVFVDWVDEITDPDDPRHAQIAKPERYTSVMRRSGVGPETFVVAYDDAQGMFAARLWWSLNYYGHTRVAVLDGGWQKWLAEGGLTSTDVPQITPSNFEARPNAALRRTGDEVLAKMNSATLVDVRTLEEFEGKASRAARKGHIPGAVNLPRTSLVTVDGTMLPKEALLQRFAEAGVDDSTPEVITYCNGGVSASYGLLALRVAGLEASIYDGSWKDWGNDEGKPVE